MNSPPVATLVLVATPIGNLGDLSPRGIEALENADLICCEDTRRTGRLLQHFGVSAPKLLRVDDHTEDQAATVVERYLGEGRCVVAVTDAGMPGIADPGHRLVRAVLAAGFAVSVVPGPDAVLTALVGSGLATSRFVFEGFLPRKGATRNRRLAQIAADERTSVIYESPNRTAATLAELAKHCGADRPAAVARELTKLHEEFVRGPLSELMVWAEGGVRGEVVIVVEGQTEVVDIGDDAIVEALTLLLERGTSRRDASAEVATNLGLRRRRVYELALGMDRE